MEIFNLGWEVVEQFLAADAWWRGAWPPQLYREGLAFATEVNARGRDGYLERRIELLRSIIREAA